MGKKSTNKSCIFFRNVTVLTYDLRTLHLSGASVAATTFTFVSSVCCCYQLCEMKICGAIWNSMKFLWKFVSRFETLHKHTLHASARAHAHKRTRTHTHTTHTPRARTQMHTRTPHTRARTPHAHAHAHAHAHTARRFTWTHYHSYWPGKKDTNCKRIFSNGYELWFLGIRYFR
jgi:hypothetical protein